MNTMKKTLKLCLFLLCLGAISAGILGGINLLTKTKIAENEHEKALKNVITAGVKDPVELEIASDDLIEGVLEVYTGKLENGNTCYAFNTENTNSYATVKAMIVIDAMSKKITNIVVLPGATSHSMDNRFTKEELKLVGTSAADYENKMVLITGATISSKSVKACVAAAFEQLSLLQGELTITSIIQNLTNIKEFIYHFKINNDDFDIIYSLDNETKKLSFVSANPANLGKDLEDACLALANSKLPTKYITESDKTSLAPPNNIEIITITTNEGYAGGTITAKVTITALVISNIEVIYENESFDNAENTDYVGISPFDTVIEALEKGDTTVNATGATVTSRALKSIYALAIQYIEAKKGGVR